MAQKINLIDILAVMDAKSALDVEGGMDVDLHSQEFDYADSLENASEEDKLAALDGWVVLMEETFGSQSNAHQYIYNTAELMRLNYEREVEAQVIKQAVEKGEDPEEAIQTYRNKNYRQVEQYISRARKKELRQYAIVGGVSLVVLIGFYMALKGEK